MVLALAVVVGFILGSLRAIYHKRSFQVPSYNFSWLVLAAVIPQILAFEIQATSVWISTFWAKVILVGSQILLLWFVWINRKADRMWWLALGLGLNLFVIVLNGGLMPITPQAASHVYPNIPEERWVIGERLGYGKDVILLVEDTSLAILSDRFHLPNWIPYRVAFSLGDIFIAVGIFQILWNAGNLSKAKQLHLTPHSLADHNTELS